MKDNVARSFTYDRCSMLIACLNLSQLIHLYASRLIISTAWTSIRECREGNTVSQASWNFCNHFKCSRVRLDENSSEWNEHENPWLLECWCFRTKIVPFRKLIPCRFLDSMKIGIRFAVVTSNWISQPLEFNS